MVPLPNQVHLLNNVVITTAVTNSLSSVITGLGRARSLTIQSNFTYGSGGTTFVAYVQTSFDAGATWVDIASFSLTTSSSKQIYNLTSGTPVTTVYNPTDGSLTANTSKDGLIGDQLRVKYSSTGTYAGSTTIDITVTAKA